MLARLPDKGVKWDARRATLKLLHAVKATGGNVSITSLRSLKPESLVTGTECE